MSQDEELFFRRVGLTMASEGLAVEDAMRAVLKRDEELLLLRVTKPEQWAALVSEIAAEMYQDIRQKSRA